MVICLRLHFTKDSTTNNTAAATIKHLVSIVFERVLAEDKLQSPGRSGKELPKNFTDLTQEIFINSYKKITFHSENFETSEFGLQSLTLLNMKFCTILTTP